MRGTAELGIVVFNNPATLRCLSASTGTDFELEQSRVKQSRVEQCKAELSSAEEGQ